MKLYNSTLILWEHIPYNSLVYVTNTFCRTHPQEPTDYILISDKIHYIILLVINKYI